MLALAIGHVQQLAIDHEARESGGGYLPWQSQTLHASQTCCAEQQLLQQQQCAALESL